MDGLDARTGIVVILQRPDERLLDFRILLEPLQRFECLDAYSGIAVRERRRAYRAPDFGVRATRAEHFQRIHSRARIESLTIRQNESQSALHVGIIRWAHD